MAVGPDIAAAKAVVAVAAKKAADQGKPVAAAGPGKSGRDLFTALGVVAIMVLTLVGAIWFGG